MSSLTRPVSQAEHLLYGSKSDEINVKGIKRYSNRRGKCLTLKPSLPRTEHKGQDTGFPISQLLLLHNKPC